MNNYCLPATSKSISLFLSSSQDYELSLLQMLLAKGYLQRFTTPSDASSISDVHKSSSATDILYKS